MKKKNRRRKKKPAQKQWNAPLHIPVPFAQAVEALLKVKPKKKERTDVAEHLKRYFPKEEEFLDEYQMAAYKAAELLGDDWHPNPSCDDNGRQQRDYFLKTGELHSLIFDGAAAYHDENGFSSVQIILKSSKRVVTVRVRQAEGALFAEKIVDKLAS